MSDATGSELKSRRFLFVVVGLIVILIVSIVTTIYLSLNYNQRILVPNQASDHSNIAAIGVITEMYPNFTSYGLGGPHKKPYHVFPEVVVVNVTQILWTKDDY